MPFFLSEMLLYKIRDDFIISHPGELFLPLTSLVI